MNVTRLPGNPIIRPGMDSQMGDNVNGPSLIRVPAWVERPLGRYYLYFAHHDGRYIRLAYADELLGPWRTHEPGVLPLEASHFAGHLASPDVHVDDQRREIRLYYHGSDTPSGKGGQQSTRVATSTDGLGFTARPEPLGPAYFRVFQWRGDWYALAMPDLFLRSKDGLSGFEPGPTLFRPNMRHSALELDGDTLAVFFTSIGDCPERILLSIVELTPDWSAWRASEPIVVLEPELPWEGGDRPLLPSARGLVDEPVCQLRDPAIYREDGRTYLLYSVAGERGIALAALDE